MSPTLRIASDGVTRHTHELAQLVANELQIPSEVRQETIKSGAPKWRSRAHWAQTYLVQAGLLARPRRGYVEITEEGKLLAANLPPRLDKRYLERYPGFVEFMNRKKRPSGEQRSGSDFLSQPESDQSPEELISEAVAANLAEVQSDLLARVRELPPDAFERLVLKVLVAMGYGTEETATQTGRSGDEGIDGIIYRDELGLDRVYMQAKRYTENSVGPDAINAFFGALQRKGADRGVFITSSTFTDGARKAEQDFRNIVLIDGEELAHLMVKHGVGVEVTSTHQLFGLDEDYFEDL